MTKLKKLSLFLILVLVLSAAGCAEQTADEPPQETPSNETVETIEIPAENEEPANITADEVLKVPELQIVSIFLTGQGLDVKVKNIGNAVAYNVYFGTVSYGGSNSIAYSQYSQWIARGSPDAFRTPTVPALMGGMNGELYLYDTGYQFNGNNLTIYTRLIGSNYIGDIEPGYTASTYLQRSFDSVRYEKELLKVAWQAGDEENFVMY